MNYHAVLINSAISRRNKKSLLFYVATCLFLMAAIIGMAPRAANAAQFMIIDSPDSGVTLRARTVDGSNLTCANGLPALTCPVTSLNLLSLGFSTAEEQNLLATAVQNSIVVYATLTGSSAPSVQIQKAYLGVSPTAVGGGIYQVVRQFSGPCPADRVAANSGPSPQSCLYANPVHVSGIGAGGHVDSYDLSQVALTASAAAEVNAGVSDGSVFMRGSISGGVFVASQCWILAVHVPIPLDAKPISQSVPTTMYAGETYAVSIVMQNVGSSTWTAAQAFRLGSQNPQDNFTWGPNRILLAPTDSIAPGGMKTFSFNVQAPAAPGLYHFQWQMVQDGVSWFGTKTLDTSVSLPTTTEICPGHLADTTGLAPASASIQACLAATPVNGTFKLVPGTYMIDTQILIDHALTFTTLGLDTSASNCTAVACARLVASPTLNDPATGAPKGVVQVSGANVIIDHMTVDGNRLARLNSQVGHQCAQYANYWGYNFLVLASNVTFRHSLSENALCASALGWYGDYATITDSVVQNNGNHLTLGVWSDGMTIGSNNAQILRNQIIDSSDVGLVLMYGKNSHVQGNHIEQSTQTAFGGLVIFRQLDGTGMPLSDGDYTGAVVEDNTIDCNHQCFIGLGVGARPWESVENARIFGATVRDNTIADASFGLTISLAGSVTSPVHVYGNQASGAYTTSFLHLCSGNLADGNQNYDISPGQDILGQPIDSVVDTNGEPLSLYRFVPLCTR